ncbi:MAG: DmsC/YnfH family molybdoenzyme membrane anchor subunit [Dokdonella sp.]
MRPTFSIIFFTVASGAGYGLWLLMALANLLLWPEHHQGDGIELILLPQLLTVGLGAGFLLVSSGLASSLGHLGKPQRAWRAFSQWRSSWLSREGISAVLTYLPVLAIAFAILHDGWLIPETGTSGKFESSIWMMGTLPTVAGLLLVTGSLATLYCTANIYACLKPIRAWHNRYVIPAYLIFGIYSGGLFAWALTTLPQGRIHDLRYFLIGIVVFAIGAGLLKVSYWRFVDQGATLTTGNATGLGALGTVRSFEQPHTEENYLTHEMGFRVARKHSRKLRLICLLAGFVVPALLALLCLAVPKLGMIAAWLSLLSGLLGIFIERWLFFAEAKHAVMLYYGARSD